MIVADEPLKIDWANMPTYNTIMAVAAGAGLLMVVALARRVLSTDPAFEGDHGFEPAGWALGLGTVGLILTLTGLHMTLTWPLAAGGFPFDNVIFGEPALAFGVLLLAAALYLWRHGHDLQSHQDRPALVAKVAGPVSVFVFGMGLACLAIGAAGIDNKLFAAPPQEPISGQFADYPWVEAIFMSALYLLVGIGAVLAPFGLRRAVGLRTVVGVVWVIAGVLFLLFGALNFFTHIGLIVNTL